MVAETKKIVYGENLFSLQEYYQFLINKWSNIPHIAFPEFCLNQSAEDNIDNNNNDTFIFYDWESGRLKLSYLDKIREKKSRELKRKKITDRKSYYIDLVSSIKYWTKTLKNPSRTDPFYRAFHIKQDLKNMNIKDYWLIDATCGAAEDSIRLLTYGYTVWAFERSPLIWILLEDSIRTARLELSESSSEEIKLLDRFVLLPGDCRLFLESLGVTKKLPDVVYLDPMYNSSSNSIVVERKASPNKNMQVFNILLEKSEEESEKESEKESEEISLFDISYMVATDKVVVKRGKHIKKINEKRSSFSYVGKSTRFDVYKKIV
ncbi:MAG: class I SAM-dependent methyltransferase [Oligoflexia bacterium]|nr:class I SAM-dependent methyltransferase [Oligoflexia bacterium]